MLLSFRDVYGTVYDMYRKHKLYVNSSSVDSVYSSDMESERSERLTISPATYNNNNNHKSPLTTISPTHTKLHQLLLYTLDIHRAATYLLPLRLNPYSSCCISLANRSSAVS